MNLKEWFNSMTLSEKILSATLLVFAAYILFTMKIVFNYYKNHNYVAINGSKFTESDIMDESPELIVALKKEYQRGLGNAFSQFAQNKVISMEAKAKGMSADDFLKSLGGEPSEEELHSVFEQYKSQLGGRNFDAVKEEIRDFLKSQKGNQAMTEIAKKYEVKVEMAELPAVKKQVVAGNNPSMGPADAKVTVIEFSDFECPFCNRSQAVNKALREKYKGKIRWVFRDFPLPFHKQAMFAHIAVNCALPQNKYWEYFDLLFENSGKLSRENVINLSKKVGLEQTKFSQCIAQESVKKEIDEDMAYAKTIGVNSTPTFFINGMLVEGALPMESFEEIIEKELK